VERFFRDLTEKQLRRGVFSSVDELQEAVMRFIEKHKGLRGFMWVDIGISG